MAKHCVNWKPIGAKDIRGSDFKCTYPSVIDISYRGELLSSIFAMEKKQPISFEQAAQMAWRKFCESFEGGRVGDKPGQCNWYGDNFVAWISSLGYHIELSGDEFEPYQMSDKLS